MRYRIKTAEEFEKEFGPKWETHTINWVVEMASILGLPLPEEAGEILCTHSYMFKHPSAKKHFRKDSTKRDYWLISMGHVVEISDNSFSSTKELKTYIEYLLEVWEPEEIIGATLLLIRERNKK